MGKEPCHEKPFVACTATVRPRPSHTVKTLLIDLNTIEVPQILHVKGDRLDLSACSLKNLEGELFSGYASIEIERYVLN